MSTLQTQEKNYESIDDSHKESAPTVDTSPQFKTLEEDEEVLLKVRAKLYRFDKTGKEWRERGKGDLKILKHKQTEKIRILMRRDKTYKICANHYIVPMTKLQDAQWNDKTLIYTALADFADGEAKDEILAVQFTSTQFKDQFRKTFEESQHHMATKFGQQQPKEAPPAQSEEVKTEPTQKPEEKKSEQTAPSNSPITAPPQPSADPTTKSTTSSNLTDNSNTTSTSSTIVNNTTPAPSTTETSK